MPRYLIEVSLPVRIAAARIDSSISSIGSHFATHASWRHRNGMATGTLVVDADDRRWALGVVPPNMRSSARIVWLDEPATDIGSVPAASDDAPQSYPIAA
jgi:hypothetical protein